MRAGQSDRQVNDMLDKIKEFLSSVWSLVTISVGAAIVTLLYMLRKKQDENNALKAKEQLHQADKQSALLDQQIEQKLKENAHIDNELKNVDEQTKSLEEKRKEALKKEKARSEDEVEEYWKNN